MAEGVIELVLEDKGEGASFTEITPEDFFNFSFELNWAGYGLIAASTGVGAVAIVYLGAIGVAAFTGKALLAWATGVTVAGAGAGAAAGAGITEFINSVSDALENLIDYKSEDYSYFINRYRTFEVGQRQSIATCILAKIKKKLIDKETITDDEKRFYKAFKDLIQYEDKSSDFYNLTKTLVTIIDWLFVLNGITNVQTGNTVLLERYNKANMISKISVRVDQMLKDGFSLGDTTGIKSNLGFINLRTPYVNLEHTTYSLGLAKKYQTFRFQTLNGNSKIISDDLEEAAENIANNIEVIQNSDTPGMKKYASIIGNDFVDNIMYEGSTNNNFISFNRIGDYKYNNEIVSPDYNGWGDEDSYVGKEEDMKKAKLQITTGYIKITEGLSKTSVVSFGGEFDPKSLKTDKLSGVSIVPDSKVDLGQVCESLIDSGYALFVAELGQAAFGNKRVNQKTLFEESVAYYSEVIARVIGTVLNNIQKFYLYLEFSALFSLGKDITDELFAEANERAQQALASAASNIATGGGLDSSLEITDEQLKTRQKFVKQFLLMYNLGSLRTEYPTL